jgi:hypothetical protein
MVNFAGELGCRRQSRSEKGENAGDLGLLVVRARLLGGQQLL